MARNCWDPRASASASRPCRAARERRNAWNWCLRRRPSPGPVHGQGGTRKRAAHRQKDSLVGSTAAYTERPERVSGAEGGFVVHAFGADDGSAGCASSPYGPGAPGALGRRSQRAARQLVLKSVRVMSDESGLLPCQPGRPPCRTGRALWRGLFSRRWAAGFSLTVNLLVHSLPANDSVGPSGRERTGDCEGPFEGPFSCARPALVPP